MSHPELPDPAAVERGAQIIDRELSGSLMLRRPAQAVRSILASLTEADRALREPTTGDPIAYSAGLLLSILDTRARVLAELGGDR